MSPSLGQAGKSVPTLKICCSWIHSQCMVFLCGLRALCGKTETFGLNVQVGYNEDLERAIRTAREVLDANPRIVKSPPPEVGITRLADSGIQITLRPWCKAEDFWPVHYEIYRALVALFREEQIEIPYPQREVRLLQGAV